MASIIESTHADLYFYWICLRHASVLTHFSGASLVAHRGVGLAIGFALIGLPWKFLWSPLLDRYNYHCCLYWITAGWMLTSQVLLLVSIAALGTGSATAAVAHCLAVSWHRHSQCYARYCAGRLSSPDPAGQ